MIIKVAGAIGCGWGLWLVLGGWLGYGKMVAMQGSEEERSILEEKTQVKVLICVRRSQEEVVVAEGWE